MRHKNKWGFSFLVISMIFLLVSFNPTISGGVINVSTNISLTFIIGLVFLLLALILLVQKKGLEYLVIPVGLEKWQNPKAKSAKNAIETGHIDRVVITGDIKGEKRRYKEHDEHKRSVYDAVRKVGILPGVSDKAFARKRQ